LSLNKPPEKEKSTGVKSLDLVAIAAFLTFHQKHLLTSGLPLSYSNDAGCFSLPHTYKLCPFIPPGQLNVTTYFREHGDTEYLAARMLSRLQPRRKSGTFCVELPG
jgi:hypothetical protein